jgi:hypothetical protein
MPWCEVSLRIGAGKVIRRVKDELRTTGHLPENHLRSSKTNAPKPAYSSS